MGSSKRNPSIGPKFFHTTINEHTAVSERIFRGKAPVRGYGIGKKGPLRVKNHPILDNAFKRSSSEPGFESRSKFGGSHDLLGKQRVSIPVLGWSPAELE